MIAKGYKMCNVFFLQFSFIISAQNLCEIMLEKYYITFFNSCDIINWSYF